MKGVCVCAGVGGVRTFVQGADFKHARRETLQRRPLPEHNGPHGEERGKVTFIMEAEKRREKLPNGKEKHREWRRREGGTSSLMLYFHQKGIKGNTAEVDFGTRWRNWRLLCVQLLQGGVQLEPRRRFFISLSPGAGGMNNPGDIDVEPPLLALIRLRSSAGNRTSWKTRSRRRRVSWCTHELLNFSICKTNRRNNGFNG